MYQPLKPQAIFIVEDNAAYAKMLEEFLKEKFPDAVELKIFPTGEAALLELYLNPAVIIMDHILNSVQPGAANGLSIIKEIKNAGSGAHIILLSAQKEFEVVSKTVTKYGCAYVKKDDMAFRKVQLLVEGYLSEKAVAA